MAMILGYAKIIKHFKEIMMKYLVLLSLLAGCASSPVQLSNKAKDIEVVTLKPTGCHVVGKVVGQDNQGSKDLALNHALNQAAKLGATNLHVNQEVPNGKKMLVHATAYKCD
jgi:uncharacterized lipoprotein YajG